MYVTHVKVSHCRSVEWFLFPVSRSSPQSASAKKHFNEFWHYQCFNVCIDEVIPLVKNANSGFKITTILIICILLFADDIVLLSETRDGLQKLLDILFDVRLTPK